jgi:glycosyltransferase involved in cell wall biosynthesis
MAVNPAEAETRSESFGLTPLSVEWLGARPTWLGLPAATETLKANAVLESGDLDSDLKRRLISPEQARAKVLHAAGIAVPDLRALRRERTYDVLTVDLSNMQSLPSRTEARRLADADLLLIGSLAALREMRRRYPFLAAKTALFRTPLDFAAYDAAPETADGDVVLFAGPLTAAGGLDLVVEALAQLHYESQPPTVRVLGEGRPEERYVSWCQRRAAAAGIPLTFGAARDGAVEHAYAAATLVCVPYRDPVGSEPARHAAAAGIPIVGTEVEPLLELVADGATGYLVPIDDIVLLAHRLELLLRDTDLRGTFGRRARERAEAELSPAVAVSRLVALWSEAARRHVQTPLAS